MATQSFLWYYNPWSLFHYVLDAVGFSTVMYSSGIYLPLGWPWMAVGLLLGLWRFLEFYGSGFSFFLVYILALYALAVLRSLALTLARAATTGGPT
jgi:hypothetical protein